MKYEIKNRWNGSVQFTTELDCPVNTSERIKLGLAVCLAIKARANLEGANLARAYLEGANLACANLARANLEGANLACAYLEGANLARANLEGANLACAYLVHAYLTRANLTRANLTRANLTRANLEDANLEDANLEDANLEDANLARANLARANLVHAYLEGATGADITRPPVTILGLQYYVNITDTKIQIGCEQHLTTEWLNFDSPCIAKMDGTNSCRFWKIHKEHILTLAKAHQVSSKE